MMLKNRLDTVKGHIEWHYEEFTFYFAGSGDTSSIVDGEWVVQGFSYNM